MDSGLKRAIEQKVRAGERLSSDDGVALFACDDLAWLGGLAHEVRTAKNGDVVLFDVTPAQSGSPAQSGAPVDASDAPAPSDALAQGGAPAEGGALAQGGAPADVSADDPRSYVEHLLQLREHQDETGDLQVYVPQPGSVTPAESLKTVAIARLVLDNVPHIGCAWATTEPSLAQLSLNFGADDLDGSDATHRDELLDLIRDAGFTPTERNARYEVVRSYDGPTPLAERRSEPQPMWS